MIDSQSTKGAQKGGASLDPQGWTLAAAVGCEVLSYQSAGLSNAPLPGSVVFEARDFSSATPGPLPPSSATP